MRVKMGCAVLLVGLFATGAMGLAYTEEYEMEVSPTTAAGTVNGHVLYVADPAGVGTLGPEGFDYDPAGYATFLDDADSSGNQGLAVGNDTQAAWFLGSSNYTADFKIQVLGNQAGTGGRKSLSFWSGNGRGLQLNTGDGIFVSGSGSTGSGWGHDFTQWTDIRVIVDASTNIITMYWDESDNNINDGDYTHSGITASMGGSGFWGGSTVGFAIGSTGGSSTTFSNYNLDYFRVYSGGTNPTEIYTPEPTSLILLVLGAAPLLRRRR